MCPAWLETTDGQFLSRIRSLCCFFSSIRWHLAVAHHVDEATLSHVAPADECSLRQQRLLGQRAHAHRSLLGVANISQHSPSCKLDESLPLHGRRFSGTHPSRARKCQRCRLGFILTRHTNQSRQCRAAPSLSVLMPLPAVVETIAEIIPTGVRAEPFHTWQ